MAGEAKDLSVRTNAPKYTTPTGGNPAKPSNAGLMRGTNELEYYGAGKPVMSKAAELVAELMARMTLDRLEKEAYARLPQIDDLSLRVMCAVQAKLAGDEREPKVDDHKSAPQHKMRPRAELVLYTKEGVYAIDKGDYLLFPGGGVDDGEQPRDAAIRETIEEANRHPINVEGAGVVESVWPTDSGNDFWDDSEFDGERTYFFTGLDSGEAGITHDDLEDFKVMPWSDVISRLEQLIDQADQEWAVRNNQERLNLVRQARRRIRTSDGLQPKKQAAAHEEWIGVDFDGTLSTYDKWRGPGHLGQPIKPMVRRVKRWLDQGRTVKIFTARVAAGGEDAEKARRAIGVFCKIHFGQELEVTAVKDAGCVELWDDRAVQVVRNVGTKVAAVGMSQPPVPTQQPSIPGVQPDQDQQFVDQLKQRLLGQTKPQVPNMAPTPPEPPAASTVPSPAAQPLPKQADAVQLMPRRQFIQITPEGKVLVKRRDGRRFDFPEVGIGRKAPYEPTVQYIPPTGVPEPGYHGYNVDLYVGETEDQPEEGYEAVPAADVLRDMYASMGVAANRPYRGLDRARARALLRYMKNRTSSIAP